jgi:RimJ/RimL family protein N-acetyltransferase
MAHPLWPLFDLRITTDRLELHLPTNEGIAALCEVALAGVHEPDDMPFAFPWTRKPRPRFEREFAQFHWGLLANWQPNDWNLELMVTVDGQPIGAQGVAAKDFASLRRVGTGSWLGRAFQGKGYGKEMRQAILGLAFDGLGAKVAETEAFQDNKASAGVSRAVGYRENGVGMLAPDGIPRDTLRFRMTAEDWRARPRPDIAIEGLEPSLKLFGVGVAGEEAG